MAEKTCLTCKFLVSLTESEKESHASKFIEHKLHGKYFGACVYNKGDNHTIVYRYIMYPVRKCPYYQRGFFTEKLGLKCSRCHEGDIVIRRPGKNMRTRIVIGCSRYPQCSYTANAIKLEKVCRYCNVPLLLRSGDQIDCYCPQCKRRGMIPITLQSRPHLLTNQGKCLHGYSEENCTVCQRSKDNKQSLVDVELPQVAAYTNTLMSQEDKHEVQIEKYYKDQRDEYESYDDEDDFENQTIFISHSGDDKWDERELHYQELDSDATDWSRSDEEGWFYPE